MEVSSSLVLSSCNLPALEIFSLIVVKFKKIQILKVFDSVFLCESTVFLQKDLGFF